MDQKVFVSDLATLTPIPTVAYFLLGTTKVIQKSISVSADMWLLILTWNE